CISWDDAKAYVAWLSRKTNNLPYRLASESEWEFAAAAGPVMSRFWGDGSDGACNYANAADQTQKSAGWSNTFFDCSDGYVYTAPVGSFRPNGYGLFDMLGN